jgi:Zn finger protein HypA/HybF involved in hydrogenase expression
VDGDWLNNEPENVRFICPNCHSQTPNFGSKNIGRLTELDIDDLYAWTGEEIMAG